MLQAVAVFAVVLCAQSPADDLAKFKAKVEALGLTLEQRKKAHVDLCAAEDRAQWEADRLFDQSVEFEKWDDYNERTKPKYRAEVAKRYGITPAGLKLIGDEALIEKWPMPDYPSCDVKEAARGLSAKVYANRGTLTYHRARCSRLAPGADRVTLTIHKAVTTRGAEPCKLCNP